jgi:hypothetical protein
MMDDLFGPFSLDPAQVAGLTGALFQELVNRLLAAEMAGARLASVGLDTSYQSNVGDQGVDARVEAAQATEWIPTGTSAWQFKAGTMGPETCANELAGAAFAHEVLKNGGTYRLVLGKSLEPYEIADRDAKMREKAAELGFELTDDQIKIIDGNKLARWVERYPALSVSQLLRQTGYFAIDFKSWALKDKHKYLWVESAERDELREAVLGFLQQSDQLDLRIEGESGRGKTRGIMETLRDSPFEQLVVYVGHEDDLNSSVINHLTRQRRSAVLVIDECTRRKHKVFAEQLEVDTRIRLITVGQEDTSQPQYRPLGVSKLPNDVIDKVLRQTYPSLRDEPRRLVVDNCDGNVGWALRLGKAVLDSSANTITDLIDAAGLREFILNMVASDGNFLAVSALALLSRFGVDGEVRVELEQLAAGLDLPLEQLEAASRRLDEQNLLTKHGRYRAVSPQPLAVLLASRAWDELGDKILESLLPMLDSSASEQLFLRAGQIGSSGSAAIALNKILGTEGPFASFESLAAEANSRLLIQLAIIAPEQVTTHLAGLIDAASDDELRDFKSIRRNLVWTLEKLVWHTATFERAADMLLRLALAENETFSNNATGTWISLFGGMLPATAARPAARIAYLHRIAEDNSATVRKLAIDAASTALDTHGSTIMVSGELQGGVVVEPRGTPIEWRELWEYVTAAVDILRTCATSDSDPAVREAASKALVSAIHPFLEREAVREPFFDALAQLPPDGRRQVWTEVNHLRALFDRVETPEFAEMTKSEPDTAPRRFGLDLLTERLPAPDASDELRVLAAARRWEWEDGELQHRILAAAQALPASVATDALLELSASEPPPEAAFEVGAALYAVAARDDTIEAVASLADTSNVAAITGYLQAKLNDDHPNAFDEFIDGPVGANLTPSNRLALTVRGPKSADGWRRVLSLQKALPVHEASRRMFGWHTDVPAEHLTAMLADWIPRIETQVDYNAAVDVIAMMQFRQPELPDEVETQIADLVDLRGRFHEVGQQSYDWAQLARRRLKRDPSGLLRSLLAQVDSGAILTFDGSQEQQLLRDAIVAAGPTSINEVLGLIQGGSWRVQMDLRGWVTGVYPAEAIRMWIDDDIGRARLVASLANVGEGSPSELVAFLLTSFDDDDKIGSALYGNFISGFWTGNESSRLSRKIAQLAEWLNDRQLSAGVKKWAREVITSLKERREVVLIQEAEEDR